IIIYRALARMESRGLLMTFKPHWENMPLDEMGRI
ncbi:unnamed protein product, partial [marine sediment metagenome]